MMVGDTTRKPERNENGGVRIVASQQPSSMRSGAGSRDVGVLETVCRAAAVDGARPAKRPGSSFLFPSFDDPAAAIGLAVRFAQRARRHAVPMPASVLALLNAHVGRGDPSCRVVWTWLVRIGLATRSDHVEPSPQPADDPAAGKGTK
jgi:hypothetical protein